MNLSGISFFDHEDFEFAKDEEEEIREQKKILENSISLIIMNKKIYRDEKLKGFVKIYVRRELPRGHVEMKCESLLNLKIRKNFDNLTVNETIENYKELFKPVKKREPFFSRIFKGFKIKKFSEENMKKKLNKVQPKNKIRRGFNAANFLRRMDRISKNKVSIIPLEGRGNLFMGKDRRLGSPLRVQRHSNVQSDNFSRKGSSINDEISRRESANLSSDIFKPPGSDIEGEIVEKSYLLKSQVMTLFSLRDAVKFKSGLLIPFELKIPQDMPTSVNQKINLSKIVDIEMIRNLIISEKKMSNITKSLMKKKQKYANDNREVVSIEHKLIVYFVSHEDKKGEDQDYLEQELFVEDVNKISSEEKFEVFDIMENKDFEKYISNKKFSAKLNKQVSKCCMIALARSKSSYSFKISVDRLKFRNKDSSINFVISYPNILLSVFDYIDVILVCTSTLKDEEVTKEEFKKNNTMKSVLDKEIKIEKKKSTFLTNFLKQKSKGKAQHSLSLKETEKLSKHETRPVTMNSLKRENKLKTECKFEKKIERIVYASSLDILGKRKIKTEEEMAELADNNDRTELVHRINLSDIIINLQTVQSEKLSIEYTLQFYASIGPLSFTKKINEIPLTFISIPQIKDIVPSEEISKKFEEAHAIVRNTEHGMMLPYARVEVK